MQILHSGPLAISEELVAASPVRSRIGRLVPNEMSLEILRKQIDDFIKCAELCKKANYDGVEIIGSAGYFISTFLSFCHANVCFIKFLSSLVLKSSLA